MKRNNTYRLITFMLAVVLTITALAPVTAEAKSKRYDTISCTTDDFDCGYMIVGQTFTFRAETNRIDLGSIYSWNGVDSAKEIKWTSSNKSVATVKPKKDGDVKVTAKKAGKITLTAKILKGSDKGKVIKIKITVKDKIKASKVKVELLAGRTVVTDDYGNEEMIAKVKITNNNPCTVRFIARDLIFYDENGNALSGHGGINTGSWLDTEMMRLDIVLKAGKSQIIEIYRDPTCFDYPDGTWEFKFIDFTSVKFKKTSVSYK